MSEQSADEQTKFKRNYRACLNCRTRKVKCDLGSVDSPRDGKCVRCLRERKDCIFIESKRGGSSNVIAGKKRKMGLAGEYGGASQDMNLQNPVSYQHQYQRIEQGANQEQFQGHYQNQNQNQRQQQNPYQNQQHYNQNQGQSQVPAQNLNQQHVNQQQSNSYSQHTPKAEPTAKKPLRNDQSFVTAQGALVFLAKAAGTIAEADERDRIDARTKHQQFEKLNQRNDPTPPYTSPFIQPSDPLQHASISAPQNSTKSSMSEEPLDGGFAPFIAPVGKNNRMSIPPVENSEWVRPRPSIKLGNIEYIGPNGILSEIEAEKLINLFFSTMHPFFPYIPNILHSPDVLAGYPILLCAILTISARCHQFDQNENVNGNTHIPRNIEVHDRLWLYVQRLISQTVWAEASTRSIGTVFAFLLFTEWNPRAIHWRWSDYANKPDDIDLENDGNYNKDFLNEKKGDDGDNLAGLGAMRRSDRMAWMLIGSAVRLAQDMGFIEKSCKTFLATHVAEINSVMNISRRSMLSHSISEVDVEFDFNDERHHRGKGKKPTVDSDSEDDEDDLILNGEDSFKPDADFKLKFKFNQMAKIELLQIMSLGYESLYGYKAQLGGLNQRQNLSVLSILTPLLNNWGKKYKKLLVPINPKLYNNHNIDLENPKSKHTKEVLKSVDRESLIFDYHYAKLYIYSLALSPAKEPTNKKAKSKSGLKLDEVSKSARFIEIAFNSAKEILAVTHRIHRLRMLKFMPVRWVTRIVRAVAFVVKCYLTLTAHNRNLNNSTSADFNSSFNAFDSTILSLSLISTEEIMQIIQKAAITLREASPDELHLCTRYSNVLMYLCSEMKNKNKNSSSSDEEEDQSNNHGPQDDNDTADGQYQSENQNVDVNQKQYQHLPNQIRGQVSGQGQGQGTRHPPIHLQSSNPYYYPNPSTSDSVDSTPPILPSNVPQVSQNFQDNFFGDANATTADNPNANADSNRDIFDNDHVFGWFVNNNNVGLDFVEPWTEMIEQQLNSTDFRFGDGMGGV